MFCHGEFGFEVYEKYPSRAIRQYLSIIKVEMSSGAWSVGSVKFWKE